MFESGMILYFYLVVLIIGSMPADMALSLGTSGDRLVEVGSNATDLLAGQNATFGCFVTSAPAANIQLLKDGLPLQQLRMVNKKDRKVVIVTYTDGIFV